MATRIPSGLYLTIAQYAELCGLSKQNIYKAIKGGRVPVSKVGRTYLINKDAVLIDKRIKSGRYVGVRALRRGDMEAFNKARQL